MEVASFAEIEDEFTARTRKIVWCSVATMDRQGRPRTRVLHPIWEGMTGYIATGRSSFKAKHLANKPYVSLMYWHPDLEHGLAGAQLVYVEARTEWLDGPADRRRIWDLYKNTPPPVGYDPAIVPAWKDGPESGEFGVLRLTPWRIELTGIAEMAGQQPMVWRNQP
jgi:general stress protein 26